MKYIILIIVFIVLAVGGVFVIGNKNKQANKAINNSVVPTSSNTSPGSNVKTVDGKQVITIDVKGGYSPAITQAKADTSTVLELKTNGTVDCSSSVVIKSLKYNANLKPTDTAKIDIPAQNKGAVINGTCGMGMYNFQIQFI